MNWFDVAMILFSCVAANHLGLVNAIEKVINKRLPIFNCPRCLSFWSVLAYMIFAPNGVIVSVATSFLCASLAHWVSLIMGFTDKLFNELYDKIYSTTEDTGVAETERQERT